MWALSRALTERRVWIRLRRSDRIERTRKRSVQLLVFIRATATNGQAEESETVLSGNGTIIRQLLWDFVRQGNLFNNAMQDCSGIVVAVNASSAHKKSALRQKALNFSYLWPSLNKSHKKYVKKQRAVAKCKYHYQYSRDESSTTTMLGFL